MCLQQEKQPKKSKKANKKVSQNNLKVYVWCGNSHTNASDAAPPSQGTDSAAQEKVNTMWAFYGKHTRKKTIECHTIVECLTYYDIIVECLTYYYKLPYYYSGFEFF